MIDPKQWQELRPLLDRALEMDEDQRAEYLDSACSDRPELRANLDALVEAYDSSGETLLERPAATLMEEVPQSVGRYQIVHRIGQGGMGEVYLAQRQDDYEQQVAVKLLRGGWTGSTLQRRFRAERQILAQLDHPFIAKLLDGGSTPNGVPYLVMELVRGQPLDEYCRTHALTLRHLLELFLDICAALEYAHRNLVVHRDLKPSNILITEEGTPKLLDFGIAKILQPEAFPQTVVATQPGSSAMTPEYASPEQVRGERITTATDVYSLGVLLYRLLTGARPYEFDGRDLSAMTEAICRSEPTRPSSAAARATGESAVTDGHLGRSLRGDLDAIVLKALRKEPERRYASASQLADDLRNYLSGHPVQARRGTASYRLAKFVGRHRLAVSFSAGILVLLIGFLGVLLHQRSQILSERDRTLLERNRATAVSGWLTELFELPDPSRSQGERVSARELLDKGARSIEQDVADPDLKAELMATIGRTYSQLGLLDEGERMLQSAIELVRQGAADPQNLARYLLHLGDLQIASGSYDKAEANLRESMTLAQAGDDTVAVSRARGRLGHLMDLSGRTEAAMAELDRALEEARSTGDRKLVAESLDFLAHARRRDGDLDTAARLYGQALSTLRDLHGERHADIAGVLGNLAEVEKWRDPELSEQLFQDALEMQRQIFGERHPVVATSWNNLGLLYYEQGQLQNAEEAWQHSLRLQEEIYGEDNHQIALTRINLATIRGQMGDPEQAEAALRRSLALLEREVGAEHPDTALCLDSLGELLLSVGRVEEARPYLERALDATRSTFGGEHWRTAPILTSLGSLVYREGDVERATELLTQAIAVARKSLGVHHPVLPATVLRLASMYERADDDQAALDVLHRAEDIWTTKEQSLVEGLIAKTQTAGLLRKLDRQEEAVPAARKAVEAWRGRPDYMSNPWALRAQDILTSSLIDLRRYDEAEDFAFGYLERMDGAPDSRRQRVLVRLVRLYEESGQPEEAAKYQAQLDELDR